MQKIKLFKKRKYNPTKSEVARFCGQLQMLLASGVPLLEGLRIIRNLSQRKDYENVIQKISEGESLGKALQDNFPPMVISSLEGAEKVGDLEGVLARLSTYYEDRAEVEEKIKSALVYPSFVIILCMASLFVLFLFVLPGFKTLFADLDADLPFFTRVIVNLGEIFSKTWYIPILSFLVFGGLLLRYKKTKHGSLALDNLCLKIRTLSREQIIQSFRTLGSLLQGGISIIEALNTTINTSKNSAFRGIVCEIKVAIENGEKLSEVLARYKIFPKEAIQMISVGENSGKLAEMLLSISNFYEKERESFIKRFTTLLEPALTLFVGVVVGIIAVAMFLPMINVISRLQ